MSPEQPPVAAPQLGAPDPAERPDLLLLVKLLQFARNTPERRRRMWRRVPLAIGAVLVVASLGFALGMVQRDDPATAVDDLLADAEAAVDAGEVDRATDALDQAYREGDDLSGDELVEFAETAARIAEGVAEIGTRDDALVAWAFVIRMYIRADQPEQAENARQSRDKKNSR